MKPEDMKKYEQDVLKLKDIFKDKIDILLGYEVDFFTKFYARLCFTIKMRLSHRFSSFSEFLGV